MNQLLADFRKAGHCSYAYTGAGFNSTTVMANHVIAYESAPNHAHGISYVLYGDGSVHRLEKAEMDHVLYELANGRNPPQ